MEDNPYQAPLFTDRPKSGFDDLPRIGFDDGIGIKASFASEAEIRAFVGRRADYYLRKWHPALYDSRTARGSTLLHSSWAGSGWRIGRCTGSH
jgi:hypothetical protein